MDLYTKSGVMIARYAVTKKPFSGQVKETYNKIKSMNEVSIYETIVQIRNLQYKEKIEGLDKHEKLKLTQLINEKALNNKKDRYQK